VRGDRRLNYRESQKRQLLTTDWLKSKSEYYDEWKSEDFLLLDRERSAFSQNENNDAR